MRRSRLGAAGVLALVVAGAIVSSSALAFFTTSGTGNAAADVTRLEQPSITGAVVSPGGSVALAWKTVTPPGPGTVTYAVSRDGEDAGGTCAAVLTLTTCIDTNLTAGAYQYTVTARWRSWTTEGAPAEAEVEVEAEEEGGAPDHFALSASSATPTAGEADDLTVVAQDAYGHTATEYSGSHKLTFSGASNGPKGNKPTVSNSSGSAVAFGKSTALKFESGVATVEGSKNGQMKLYASGQTEIETSDGTISTASPLTVNVASAEASTLTLEAATTKPVAGEADDLTIVVKDTYGNPAAEYSGPRNLAFSGASASPGGNMPTVSSESGAETPFGTETPIDFVAGVAEAAGEANGAMRLYKSGSATVKVSDGSLSDTLSTTTTAGPTTVLQLAASTATPAVGAADKLTTTAQDAYANTTTAYTGIHYLTLSGATASPGGTLPTVASNSGAATAFGEPTALNFNSGVASATASKNGAMKLYAAGPVSVSESDGTATTPAPLELSVSSGAAARFALTGVAVSTGALEAACLFACTLSGLGNKGTVSAHVAVTDGYGNTVSELGGGHAAKVTTSGSGTVVGSPLSIPSSGVAETTGTFTFTAKSNGNYTETIDAAASSGASYTSATLTASR